MLGLLEFYCGPSGSPTNRLSHNGRNEQYVMKTLKSERYVTAIFLLLSVIYLGWFIPSSRVKHEDYREGHPVAMSAGTAGPAISDYRPN